MSIINKINNEKIAFTFNEILQSATQEEVYNKVCKKAVKHVFDGYNACVLATGQTSAGKSYTIVGDEALTYKTRGTIARSIEDIFKLAESQPGTQCEIKFSALELLNDKILDLLNQKARDFPSIVEINNKTTIKNLA